MLAQTKVWHMARFWPANREVCLLIFVRWENFALYHNKMFLRADPCCLPVIKEFAHAFSCAYVELWMHLRSLKSTQKLLFLLSKPPTRIRNLIYAPLSMNKFLSGCPERLANYSLRRQLFSPTHLCQYKPIFNANKRKVRRYGRERS